MSATALDLLETLLKPAAHDGTAEASTVTVTIQAMTITVTHGAAAAQPPFLCEAAARCPAAAH